MKYWLVYFSHMEGDNAEDAELFASAESAESRAVELNENSNYLYCKYRVRELELQQ